MILAISLKKHTRIMVQGVPLKIALKNIAYPKIFLVNSDFLTGDTLS